MKQIRIKSSLSRRFSLSTIMVVTSILLVICLILIAYSIKNSDTDMKTRLENTIRSAQASISYSLWNVQNDVVKAQTKALSNEKGIAFIEIRDEDGKSIARKPEIGDFSFLEENNPGDKGRDYLYQISDLIYESRKVGSIRVAIDKTVFQRELFTSILMIIGVTIVIIIAISKTSIFVTKRYIFQPLSKLEYSAELITKGNLDTIIDNTSEDEIGKLAKSFDGMRLAIKQLIDDLQSANKSLDDSNKILEKKVDERTKELKNAIELTDKNNQALNLFIANMSHDIRTPMHNILGFVDLLEKQVPGEVEKNYISVIKSNSNLLLQLLNSILDLSKIRAGKLELMNEPVDLQAIFSEVQRSFLIKVEEKKLDFKIIVDHVFPQFIYLDGGRLRQVLMNLVGNAVKFTEKGHVTLVAKVYSTWEEESTIDFSITVEDTGKGIDSGKIKEIFEPFAQEDGSISYNYGGTGLGLSISKALVELMGGTIQAESEPGKGSLFRMDFKNVETKLKEANSTEKQLLPDIESIIFEKKTVLVVEDNKQSREFLKQYLEAYGLEVIEAEDGKQGVEFTKKYYPDLILMDMKMPVMSGFEAVKRIKEDEELQAISIIAFTAHALKEEEEKIMALGCCGFLRKPVSRIQLVMELTKHLPYTRKEFVESASPVSASTEEEFLILLDQFPAMSKEKIEPLIEALEKDFQDKYQAIQKSLIIKDAENFALDIKKLGTNSGAEILNNWADRLLTEIQLVNINKIALAIAVFPRIIEHIKSNQGDKNE